MDKVYRDGGIPIETLSTKQIQAKQRTMLRSSRRSLMVANREIVEMQIRLRRQVKQCIGLTIRCWHTTPLLQRMLQPGILLRCGIALRILRSPNGRFLRHRFSPKPTRVRTPKSLPKKKPRCQRGGVPCALIVFIDRGIHSSKAYSSERAWSSSGVTLKY